MKKIFITANLPGDSVEILKENFDIEIFPYRRSPTREELIRGARNCSALVTMVTDNIDKDVINSSDELEIISNCGVGYENIDIEHATKRGVYVTNTPGVLTEATADLAWSLITSVARRVLEGDRLIREGEFINWEPTLLLGQNIYDKTLGIYGMGRIGNSIARRAKGFNMNIFYHNRNRNADAEKLTNARYVDFTTLLNKSDYIVISAPLNAQSAGRFGADEFRQMKKTSIIINVGRGKIINENDLAEALEKNEIWGAGLDVFENEPVVSDKLLKLKNTVLLPHLGSASYETRCTMSEMAICDVLKVLDGKTPVNPVNKLHLN